MEIHNLILKKLKEMPNADADLAYYRTVNYKTWNDNEFLESMAQVIFSSIKWETVKSRWIDITEAFSNFDVNQVASYTEEKIKELMENSKIIRWEPKIRAIVENARKIQEIRTDHKSFLNWLENYVQEKNFDRLIEDLQQFSFIGEVNVFDLLKEWGLPFIKADLHIRRFLFRLGLIENEEVSQETVQKVCEEISKETNEPLPAVDYALWRFGREICQKKPLCDICNLTKYCEKWCQFRML